MVLQLCHPFFSPSIVDSSNVIAVRNRNQVNSYRASLSGVPKMLRRLGICTGCPKMIVPRSCGHCEGAAGSMISVFTQLHRSSLKALSHGK